MSTLLVILLGWVGFLGSAALVTRLAEKLAGNRDAISQSEQEWIRNHARNSRT